jgi:multicomponent Na+:H+ antiporter subunit G
MIVFSVLGIVVAAAGIVFAVIGTIGILRLPDFYTRMHAAGKLDTAAIVLSMVGIALLDGPEIADSRLILIALFVAIANPASTHALTRSALRSRLEPWTRPPAGGEDAR